MIGFGLTQLIEDEETPETMLGSLKALKHYTRFPAEDKGAPPHKKRRKLQKMQKVEIIDEPVEYENGDQASEQPNDD